MKTRTKMSLNGKRILFVLTAMVYFQRGYFFDIRQCSEPLGMESGAIPDEAISASSSYVPNVGPRNGRLRVEKAGGGWCPKQQVERGIREYLQVDLGLVHIITGIQTQGRYDRGRGQEYAEEYTIEYWRPGFLEWKEYLRWDGKQIMRGNSDTSSVESQKLLPTIFASQIRILPYSVHRRTVCLRMELLGCPYDGGILSYSTLEHPETNQGLGDSSYDGERIQGTLRNGLGRLVDGEIGADNYRLDIGYGKGNGWVGWKNDSKNYVEFLFEFDQIRNFSAVYLYTNNFLSRNVQVFSKAKIMFSIGGIYYNGATLTFNNYISDRTQENARNVSIYLHHRLARFIKMRLYFADKWLMLSEITFDSVPVFLNMTEEEAYDSEENELVISSHDDNFMDLYETIAARKDGDGYVEVIIGVLTAIVLLLLVVFLIILVLSRRHKLQGSPTLFRNPFGVTINMKDLLMNFTSTNNVQIQSSSNHPTPVSQCGGGHSSVPSSSVSLERYQASFATPNYASTAATLRVTASSGGGDRREEEEDDEPPEVPPLPASPTLHENPIHSYTLNNRSLQPPISLTLKPSNKVNLGTYFPKERENRKRFNTAPREKQRQIPPPVVYWNIAPSMGHIYSCKEVELLSIPRYSLAVVENIGSCHAGEVNLCETNNNNLDDENMGRYVLVKVPNLNQHLHRNSKGNPAAVAGSGSGMEYLREVRFLAGLNDENICKVLGICATEHPPWTVIEYGDVGDLTQYLQFMANRNRQGNVNEPPISVECLQFMAVQIASGMKYLESKHVTHKDLAARNCVIGRGYVVKICDVAMSKAQYKKDYAEIGGRPPTPIRWLPWESILLDRYTCASSVWSFAVTFWEILTFAIEKPYSSLSNEQVIQNAEHMYYGGELQALLYKPSLCSEEIYDLMCQCWKRDDANRPTFKDIYLFLKHINKDYVPSD